MFRSFVLTFAAVVAFSAPYAHAQQAGVQLQPAVIEESANPGAILEQTMSVRNVSPIEQTYYLVKRDISGVTENNQPIFAEEGAEVTGYELSSWLELSSEPLVVPPGATVQVPIKVSVPANATPGSHFGGVFVTVEPPRLRESGASVGYEVGSIVSIRIAGDVTESARIRSFSTDKLMYGSPQVLFTTRVENPGNVLIRPRGPLEIYDMFGNKVELLSVNDSLGGVFPGTTRNFDIEWKSRDFSIGRYQAIVSLIYGEQGRETTVSQSTSFWILPLNVILPVIGILAFLVIAIYFGIKIHIRRALEQYQTPQRRGVVYRRRDSGITRLTMIAIAMLGVTALFLILLLVLLV